MNAFRQAKEKYSFKTKWQQMEKDLEQMSRCSKSGWVDKLASR